MKNLGDIGILAICVFGMSIAIGCSGNNSDPVCGDGAARGDEICDGIDLGGQTCQGLGHDGGRLYCTDQCTLDEASCHDCGADDPCAGIACSNHGRCRTFDCQPYCECDAGYMPAMDHTCLSEGSCLQIGEDCTNSLQCCYGWCTEEGKCGMRDCIADFQCAGDFEENREGCCVELPIDIPELGLAAGQSFCSASALDGQCGTQDGTCGSSCVQGFNSDCGPGLLCASRDIDFDPYSYCAPLCETDDDCTGCASEAIPGSTFSCLVSTAEGDKFCRRDAEACSSDSDCPAGLACTVAQQPDGSYAGACYGFGGLDSGASCVMDNEDFNALPWDERCASTICYRTQCSGWCDSDADCPTGMSCGRYEDAYNLCSPAEGSLASCERDADCQTGEICIGANDMDGVWHMRCVTWACDPAEASCLDAGEPCGQGLPNCSSRACGTYSQGRFCWTSCQTQVDCPEGMVCVTETIGDVQIGSCAPFSGSGTACEWNADCPAGEVCQYASLHGGIVSICVTETPDLGGQGEACTGHTDCHSLLCLGAIGCSELCTDDSHCEDGYMCRGFNFSGGDQTYTGCWPWDGSGLDCESEEDCLADEACKYFRREEGSAPACGTADPEAGGQGEACTTGTDCRSGLCLWNACVTLCAEDAHCPEGNLCNGFGYSNVEGIFGVCLPWDGSGQACQLDSDCPAEEACSLIQRDGGDELEYTWACLAEKIPGGQTGDACNGFGDDPCYNSLCLYNGINTFCSATCLSTGDCPTSMVCGVFDWQGDVGVCAPMLGTSDPCFTDADCATPDEVCSFWIEFGQPPRGACVGILGEGTAGPGEACEVAEDCINRGCRMDVCFLQCNTTADCEALGLECTHYEFPDGQSLPMCLPAGEHSPYCTLCELDADCQGEAACIDSVLNPGERYCSLPCTDAADCPEGASCVDVDGAMHCTPDTDTCIPG